MPKKKKQIKIPDGTALRFPIPENVLPGTLEYYEYLKANNIQPEKPKPSSIEFTNADPPRNNWSKELRAKVRAVKRAKELKELAQLMKQSGIDEKDTRPTRSKKKKN